MDAASYADGSRGRGAKTRPLERSEKQVLALLGVPTLAITLAITVVSSYMPVLARSFTRSTLVIGMILGIEGVMALWLPLIVGAWSDRLETRWGGRIPFLVVATPVTVAAMAAMGFVRSISAMAAVVAIFFVGYFIAYEPYRALYPDAVPNDIAGRAQGNQALWRGAGTGLALLGGGVLLSVGKPVPFVFGGALLGVAMLGFAGLALRRGLPRAERAQSADDLREKVSRLRDLVAQAPALRSFLFANALWEASLAALKSFVVLYLVRGLHFSTTDSSLIIGATSVFILLAAVLSGKLGDRYGNARIMGIAAVVYGGGLLVPFLFTNRLLLAAMLPLVAVGGGSVMTLPYAIAQPLMPESGHGVVTGYYSVSRGIGVALGPLFAGLAIDQHFSPAGGYSAMWLVCSVAVLASLLFVRRLRRYERTSRSGQG